MSTACTPALPAASQTTRQFGQAVVLSLAVVAFGCVLYAIEKFLLGYRHRFIENPTEVMVRSFGLAHFLIGWLFLVSSTGMRSSSGLMRLVGWSLLGGLLCLGYHAGGGGKNSWVVLGFYSLFLIHEVRDQAELFVARGDAPNASGTAHVLRWLGVAVMLALLALLLAGYAGHAAVLGDVAAIERVPAAIIMTGLGVLTMGSLLAGLRFVRLGRQSHGGLNELINAFEPLLGVYLTLAGILLTGAILGSGAFNLIILIHVMTWLVSVHQRLGPTAPSWQGLWHWLRRTRTGFVTLHLTLALAVLILLALRVHIWERAGFFNQLLSASSFPYWSLFHIAIALARRP